MSGTKKRLTQRKIGFIQGVAWAAEFVESQGCHIAPGELIGESGIDCASSGTRPNMTLI
ncbi:hypothetical protein [Burkholderia cenocepacia]|uniref:hypothetical protein n=1 Tax=Burkholderia cenocepacia TaxID=95486 RepID=UPI001B992C88|nr:hypothetical protein [Burkholderia cenocepacia]MBR8426201.1 hypothetical protein [Burkholderia cenocepacia]